MKRITKIIKKAIARLMAPLIGSANAPNVPHVFLHGHFTKKNFAKLSC